MSNIQVFGGNSGGLSTANQQNLGVDDQNGAIALLYNQIQDLDPEKRIAALLPENLPSPLPSANRGEFFLFNGSGVIEVDGTTYSVNRGDRLWCSEDDTAAGDETKWEFLPRDNDNPYYLNPVLGVVDQLPTEGLSKGDRYALLSSPPRN